MEKETIVRPSLLSADFSKLGQEINECISLGIATIHYDVMDGTFVDSISFGEPVYKSLKATFNNEIDFEVHLMTVNPLKQVFQFAKLGAKEVSIHFEALTLGDVPRIKELRLQYPSLKLGLAFNPDTKVTELYEILSLFDFILVMSVVPGKGGQSFISGSETKIHDLDEYRKEHNLNYKIGVDGGINATTGPLCLENGVDYLVAGSYYFSSKSKIDCLSSLHKKTII